MLVITCAIVLLSLKLHFVDASFLGSPIYADHDEEVKAHYAVCIQYVVPKLLVHVRRTTGVDNKNNGKVVAQAIEELLEDVESNDDKEEIEEVVHGMLWHVDSKVRMNGIVRLYNRYPEKQYMIERLAKHVVCSAPCG